MLRTVTARIRRSRECYRQADFVSTTNASRIIKVIIMKTTFTGKFKCAAAIQALTILGAGVAVTTIAAAPAMAQDYTNVTALGRVISTDGSPISGATVTVKSNEQGF